MSTRSDAAAIRAGLSHPVIDADGHWIELGPYMDRELQRIGGPRAVQGFRAFTDQMQAELEMSLEQRRLARIAQQGFWTLPARNTRDRATALMPRLLYERMDELGFDFAVLYPTAGLGLPRLMDAERRRAACRAFNIFLTEHFEGLADRMTPAAAIPTYTPEEAIEELVHVKRELGLKVVMLGSMNRHLDPSLGVASDDPKARHLLRRDVLGIDSEHDFDPVWQTCLELGLAPTFHTGGRGYALRSSPSSFVYNHIGHFAAAAEAVCKALFLGGVTRRFPGLKFGFQEGGAGWACQLLADLLEHWEVRNGRALEATNPEHIDTEALARLASRYAHPAMAELLQDPASARDTRGLGTLATGGLADIDDFHACGITSAEDLCRLFVDPFYFGCEAEDRMNAWAFDTRINPNRSRLNAMLGSDIGHFDVADMARVLPDAHTLVESGAMSGADFRDFSFANAVRFWGGADPEFFAGTAVAQAAAACLQEG